MTNHPFPHVTDFPHLLTPMLVLVFWTMGVGCLGGLRRVREIRNKRIPLASVARPRDVAAVLNDTLAMDNFNNLLQVPLLFHLWCLTMTLLQATAWPLTLGAWAYVGLRVWHTVIQVGRNRVRPRFLVWASSHAVLSLLWGGTAWVLLQAQA